MSDFLTMRINQTDRDTLAALSEMTGLSASGVLRGCIHFTRFNLRDIRSRAEWPGVKALFSILDTSEKDDPANAEADAEMADLIARIFHKSPEGTDNVATESA